MRYVLPLLLVLISCKPIGEDCSPDAAGCYCPGNTVDVQICDTLDAGLTPFCCIGHGGAEVDCGQPLGCLSKPGIHDMGATGANSCCPTP